ncbi:MAG: flavodoxin [Clostridiales bacterium]|nr:flavodoxin [Clostridiales bacterium]
MKYRVLYVSKTGNTEKLAKAIYEAIPDSSKDIQRLTSNIDLNDTETLFIGFWTNRGTCSFEVLDFLSEIHGKNIALFGTCGMGKSKAYYDKIATQVSAFIPDDNIYMGTFLCQGKMPMQVREKYESYLEDKDSDEIRAMLNNFDQAIFHPNQEDFHNASKFVKSVISKYDL